MPLLILFLVILSSTPCFSQTLNDSPEQVWKVDDRRWTVEEEYQFGKWVDETVTEASATHDSIAFIEKTYRKKDPEYADFSVRQQEHILGRLSEEWTRFECKELPPGHQRKKSE